MNQSKTWRISVLGFLIAGVIIVVISRVQAQEGFRLSILPESIAVTYNAPAVDHYVFFVGEPVRVAIRLINHTRETFAPREKRPVADQIVRTARAGYTGQGEEKVGVCSCPTDWKRSRSASEN